MLALSLIALSLTSCNDEDNLNTDQFGNGISLEAFGPCPVLRGGTLHFIGSNLDQISEIDLPGADPITQYEVLKSGRESEITITVPAEKCDTGRIVLKTNKGGTITSVTPITYREDIVLTDFYVGSNTSSKTGNVGDIVTITGDYLNLLHGVIFTQNDTVKEDQFLSHTRYQIQVAIPAEAKTGVLTLTDLAATPTEIETEQALTINLPTAGSISNTNPKSGETITITGESYDQIAEVQFAGTDATVTDFSVAADGRSLSVVVPATATDGEVTLVTKSGVEIPVGSITTVVPTNLSAAPKPVKNGADLTISGKDLDLVTTASFPNVDGAQNLKSQSASQIVVTVPVTAQEGDITLNIANGKTVTVAYTLVKPEVSGFTPAVLTAGDRVMLRGTNLDLVASVSFPGDAPLQADTALTRINATAIGTTVPAAAYGTGCTLNLKNGTTVAVTGLTINAATMPAINGTASGIFNENATVSGKNFNNVESVYIGSTKVTKFVSKTDDAMTFQVPDIAAGEYDFIMISPDGTRTVVGKFTVQSPEHDIATLTANMDGSAIAYPYSFAWGDNGRFRLMKSDLKNLGVKEGSKLIFYKNAGTTGQIQINDANWGVINLLEDANGSETVMTQVFDAAMMKAVNETFDGWSDTALILQGSLTGVTKIAILP